MAIAARFVASNPLLTGDRCDCRSVCSCFACPAIEVEVRKLNDKIRAIRGMQDYQRVRMTRNGQRDGMDDKRIDRRGLARGPLLMCCDRIRRSAYKEGGISDNRTMDVRADQMLWLCCTALHGGCVSFQLREENFRDTSESTNSRVLWWSIAQTVVLIVTAIYQLTNLKGFFKSKKLA